MGLYERVLAVTQTYLGKNSARFIERQCKMHLKIEPNALAPEHLDELAGWCCTSSKLVMDEVQAQEFGQKIRALETR